MSDQVTTPYNVPTALVIFGGTGDLAKTKLLPAFLDLYAQDLLPDQFVIIGFSRKELSDEEYQTFVQNSLAEIAHSYDSVLVEKFSAHFRYVAGDFSNVSSYEAVKTALTNFDTSIGQCTNKLFYLAVPPQYYEAIFDHIHSSQALALCDGKDAWARMLVEKPFGKDLTTAQALEEKLCRLFADEQIYRIDHYLAKDAIENIISLRFANSIIADTWNNHSIESIRINLLETKDVANRGSFYDAIGALRDVGQNHMLQIFALLTMEAADIHNPTAVRQARATALETLSEQTVDSMVRGQYEGYVGTPGVGEDSETETYFKLSFVGQVDPWRGTTFIFEAGKALAASSNEAIITFRPYDMTACGLKGSPHNHQNVLRIQFSPNEKISLTMSTKKPGYEFALQSEELVLLQEKGEDTNSPEAYEQVLYDCIAGNQTRFVSGREVEASWRFITPVLERLKVTPLQRYTPGSAGPAEIT